MKRKAVCIVMAGCLMMMVCPALALAETAQAAAIDLTPILQAVIALAAALITGRLVPWIKARTTEQQQANLAALASTLVFAAEQLYGANHGDEKLAYVVDILRTHGYDVNSKEVLAAVEAAVHQMLPRGLIYTEGAGDGAVASAQSGAN